jgi:predicted small secreted protein
MRILTIVAVALTVPFLAGCGTSGAAEDIQGEASEATIPQLGVNGYLWRASLDTLHFMPLKSADQVGGVIITEWFAEPANPNEQIKVTVYITDKRLRADAIKVSVFRQIRSASGWVDAQVNADTASKLENAILARARQLHIASAEED